MSLLFMDGFDNYISVAEIPQGKWTAKTGAGTAALVTGYGDTGLAMELDDVNTVITKTFASSYNEWCIGFHLKIAGAPVSDTNFLTFKEAGDVQTSLVITTDRKLEAYLDNLAFAAQMGDTSAAVLAVDTWYYIEVRCKCQSSDGRYTVRVDGTTWIDYTGDTDKDNNSQIDAFGFAFDAGIAPVIDNLYVCDTSGTKNNGFLGECIIHTVLPSDDTGTPEWTATPGAGDNYEDVVDGSDASYVAHTEGSVETDEYLLADLPATFGGDIAGVQSVARAISEVAGGGHLYVSIMSNSEASFDGIDVLTSSFADYTGIHEDDPNEAAGTPWTETTFNAANIKLGGV